MKKGLLVGLGLILIIGLGLGGWFIFRGIDSNEEVLPTPTPIRYVEVSVEESPFISLIPSADGHWLTVMVDRIQDAESVEYELSYETADGVTQGAIGGPYSLAGVTNYEKKILLGTQSSGNYSYHEGVENGSLTVKLYGGVGARRFIADFVIAENEGDLVSANGEFSVTGADYSGRVVVMPTFGLPADREDSVEAGVYGIFGSGSVSLSLDDVSLTGVEVPDAWAGDGWGEEGSVTGKSLVFAG